MASHGALAQEGRRRAPRCIGRLVSISKVALCQEPFAFFCRGLSFLKRRWLRATRTLVQRIPFRARKEEEVLVPDILISSRFDVLSRGNPMTAIDLLASNGSGPGTLWHALGICSRQIREEHPSSSFRGPTSMGGPTSCRGTARSIVFA
jgi:hypothetical protein